MTDRLSIYNGSLLLCGERELSSLVVETPARRYCDQAWNNGFVDEVLGAGQWRFARRAQMILADADFTAEFGHPNAFAIPDDHLRTTELCSDEFFRCPLLDYQVEGAFWLASIDPIYVSYVSNDSDYGGDLSRWPQDVVEYAKLLMAQKIIPRLSGNKTDLDRLEKKIRKQLSEAKTADAMESPTRFPPEGSWVQSRRGGRFNRERGSRTSLTG